MSETKLLLKHGTVAEIVKLLRSQGMSQRAIGNVLRFYGVIGKKGSDRACGKCCLPS